MQHPITKGSLFDHTRKSASALTGLEMLCKKFGIRGNPDFDSSISLANFREPGEPQRKKSKTERWQANIYSGANAARYNGK